MRVSKKALALTLAFSMVATNFNGMQFIKAAEGKNSYIQINQQEISAVLPDTTKEEFQEEHTDKAIETPEQWNLGEYLEEGVELELVDHYDLGIDGYENSSFAEYYSDKTLVFYFGYGYKINCNQLDDSIVFPWDEHKALVKNVIVYNEAGIELDLTKWFKGFSDLEKISFDKTPTPVTGMKEAFYGCPITTINPEGLKVDKCKDFTNAFYGNCFISLDLSSWNMESATSIEGIFAFSQNLTRIKLNGWKLNNLTNASKVFKDSDELKEVTMDGVTFGKPLIMSEFYKGCKSLDDPGIDSIDLSKVTAMDSFFEGCQYLPSLDTSGWNLGKVKTLAKFVKDCKNLGTIDLDAINGAWELKDATELAAGCERLQSLSLVDYENETLDKLDSAFKGCSRLKTVKLTECSFPAVTSANSLFEGCTKLRFVKANKWSMPSCTQIGSMFKGCKTLQRLKLSNTAFGKVENADECFANCSSMIALEIEGLDWSEVSANDVTKGNTELLYIKTPKKVATGVALNTADTSGTVKYTWWDTDFEKTNEMKSNQTLKRISKDTPNKTVPTKPADPYPDNDGIVPEVIDESSTPGNANWTSTSLNGTPWESTDSARTFKYGSTEFAYANGTILGVLSAESTVWIPLTDPDGTKINRLGDSINSIFTSATEGTVTKIRVLGDPASDDFTINSNALSGATKLENVYVRGKALTLGSTVFTGDSSLEKVTLKAADNAQVSVGNAAFEQGGKEKACELIIESAGNITFGSAIQTTTPNLHTVRMHPNGDVKLGDKAMTGVKEIVFDSDKEVNIDSIYNYYSDASMRGIIIQDTEKIVFTGGGTFNTKVLFWDNFYTSSATAGIDKVNSFSYCIGKDTTFAPKDYTAFDDLDSVPNRNTHLIGSDGSKLISDVDIINIRNVNLWDADLGSRNARVTHLVIRNNFTEEGFGSSDYSQETFDVFGTLKIGSFGTSCYYPRMSGIGRIYVNNLVASDDGTLPKMIFDSQDLNNFTIEHIVSSNGEELSEYKMHPESKMEIDNPINFSMPKGCVQLSEFAFEGTFSRFAFDISKIEKLPRDAFDSTTFKQPLILENRVELNHDSVDSRSQVVFLDGAKIKNEYALAGSNIVFLDTELPWYIDSTVREASKLTIGEGCYGFSNSSDSFACVSSDLKLPSTFNLTYLTNSVDNQSALCSDNTCYPNLEIGEDARVEFKHELAEDGTTIKCSGRLQSYKYVPGVLKLSKNTVNLSDADLKRWSGNDYSWNMTLIVPDPKTTVVNDKAENMIPKSEGGEQATDNSNSSFYTFMNNWYNNITLNAHDNGRLAQIAKEAKEEGKITKNYTFKSICDYEEVAVKKATFKAPGERTLRCPECGAVKTEIIPQLSGHKLHFYTVSNDNANPIEVVTCKIRDNTSIQETRDIHISKTAVQVTGGNVLDRLKCYGSLEQKGYKFDGWYANEDCTVPFNLETNITSETHVYAKLGLGEYNIFYNPNGGTINGTPRLTYKYKKGAPLPSDVTKLGYDFEGWYTQENSPRKLARIGTDDYGDISLEANWTPTVYKITYDLGEGLTTNLNRVDYTIEDEDFRIEAPSKDGYEFEGWTGTDLTEPTISVVIRQGSTGDRSYKAKWLKLEPTPSPTEEPTPTATVEPTEEPSPTPIETVEPSVEPSPTPTLVPTPTSTSTATVTPTMEPSSTPTLVPTATVAPSVEPTPTATVTPTVEPSPTPTLAPTTIPGVTPTVAPTVVPTPTVAPTVVPTPTLAPTPTPTVEPTRSPASSKEEFFDWMKELVASDKDGSIRDFFRDLFGFKEETDDSDKEDSSDKKDDSGSTGDSSGSSSSSSGDSGSAATPKPTKKPASTKKPKPTKKPATKKPASTKKPSTKKPGYSASTGNSGNSGNSDYNYSPGGSGSSSYNHNAGSSGGSGSSGYSHNSGSSGGSGSSGYNHNSNSSSSSSSNSRNSSHSSDSDSSKRITAHNGYDYSQQSHLGDGYVGMDENSSIRKETGISAYGALKGNLGTQTSNDTVTGSGVSNNSSKVDAPDKRTKLGFFAGILACVKWLWSPIGLIAMAFIAVISAAIITYRKRKDRTNEKSKDDKKTLK